MDNEVKFEENGQNDTRTEPGDSEIDEINSNLSLQENSRNKDDGDKLSEIIGDEEEDADSIFQAPNQGKKLNTYPEEIREMIENADQLSKKVALNSALLEKLKTELISHKMKFAENKMILADVKYNFIIFLG